MLGVLGTSNVLTAQTLGSPSSIWEYPVLTAVTTGRTVPEIAPELGTLVGDSVVSNVSFG